MTKCAKCGFEIDDGSLPIAGRHASPETCWKLLQAENARLRAELDKAREKENDKPDQR